MMLLLAWAVAGFQALVATPFLIEMLAGLPRSRSQPTLDVAQTPKTVVLMPAHDEAPHLAATLTALHPVLPPGATVLVVADNCNDDTAAIARANGADVVERNDSARRGKGFALAYGRDRLRVAPPDVVIVLDADCSAEPGALARLARTAQASGRPVQGLYLLAPDSNATAMMQVSSFAFMVKNLIRQRGLQRLGAPAPLGGTGMAFPWHLFCDAPLATDDLVEDLALSISLARAGTPAEVDLSARIWSVAATKDATLSQRARWEGGFLRTARTWGLRLVVEGVRDRRPNLAWMGLHVATPPLAALMTGELVASGIAGALAFGSEGVAPLLLSGAVLVALGSVVLAAWLLHGRRWLRAATLLRLPLYLAWKLPLYLELLTGRGPRGWVRTERGG